MGNYFRRLWANHCYKKNPDNAQKVLTKFRNYLSIENGLGQVTTQNYIKGVKRFIRETEMLFPSKDVVIGYLGAFRELEKSYSHVRNTTKNLEWYMKFWKVPIKLKYPRKPETIIKDILTEDEIQRMIKACKTIKDKAILSLLAYTGVRTKELRNLKVQDIDLKKLTLTVIKGKNSRDRIICISEECGEIIEKYLKEFSKKPKEYLFGNNRNQQISRKLLSRLFCEVSERAGIKKRVCVHILRHSLATNLLINGADLVTVQKQLGHKDIKTTLIYINYTPEIFRKQYNRYVPKYLTE
jgi:integrase/recombinase XerD